MKVGFYPYTYVRTNVMRSLLLKKEDYHKLLKMRVPEVTKYLQDNQYREDISGLGTRYSGAELIDRAIKANLDRNFEKLRRISSDELRGLIEAYLQRYDVNNIKTVLRVLYTGQDKEEAESLIYNAGTHPADYYKSILKEDSMKNAMSRLAGHSLMPAGLDADGMSLLEIENSLDRTYYASLLELAEQMPQQVNLFREFILTEIEIANMITLLRLKRENVPDDTILSILIFPGKDIGKMLKKDADGIISFLEKKYGILGMAREFKQAGSLTYVERTLKKYLLEKSVKLLHQDMLSVNVILGFMFAKETEVRNLRLLVKGKTFGLKDDFIEKELIV